MKNHISDIFLICLAMFIFTTIAFAKTKNALKYSPRDGIIHLYGAGGPHTAFIRVGKLFAKKQGFKLK